MPSRYKFLVSVAFLVGSALSSTAQYSHENSSGVAAVSPEQSPLILRASLNSTSPLATASDESQLPDSPSASQQDAQQNASDQSNQPSLNQSSSRQDQSSDPREAPYRGKKYVQHGAPPAAVGGPFEYEPRVADKKFWGLTGAMFGASIADVELTHRCEAIGTCSYLPPNMRRRLVMYGVGLPADSVITYFAYRMKRGHKSLWYLPQGAVTGANVFVAMHAYKRATE